MAPSRPIFGVDGKSGQKKWEFFHGSPATEEAKRPEVVTPG